MVILFDFRMWQHRDDDHQEDAPTLSGNILICISAPGSDNELSPWVLEGEGITWTTDRIQKVDFNIPTGDRIPEKVKFFEY